jgi:hypothetical protein
MKIICISPRAGGLQEKLQRKKHHGTKEVRAGENGIVLTCTPTGECLHEFLSQDSQLKLPA